MVCKLRSMRAGTVVPATALLLFGGRDRMVGTAGGSLTERREDESDQSFEAFARYRDMGANRSCAKVGYELGKSKTIMIVGRRKHNWVRRVVEYDVEETGCGEQSLTFERRKMAQRQARISSDIQRQTGYRVAQRLLDDEARQLRHKLVTLGRQEGRPSSAAVSVPGSAAASDRRASVNIRLNAGQARRPRTSLSPWTTPGVVPVPFPPGASSGCCATGGRFPAWPLARWSRSLLAFTLAPQRSR